MNKISIDFSTLYIVSLRWPVILSSSRGEEAHKKMNLSILLGTTSSLYVTTAITSITGTGSSFLPIIYNNHIQKRNHRYRHHHHHNRLFPNDEIIRNVLTPFRLFGTQQHQHPNTSFLRPRSKTITAAEATTNIMSSMNINNNPNKLDRNQSSLSCHADISNVSNGSDNSMNNNNNNHNKQNNQESSTPKKVNAASKSTFKTTNSSFINTNHPNNPNHHIGHLIARVVPNEHTDYQSHKPHSFRVDSSPYRSIIASYLDSIVQSVDDDNADDNDQKFITSKLTQIIDTEKGTTSSSSSTELSVVLDLDVMIQLPNRDIDDNGERDSENNIDNDDATKYDTISTRTPTSTVNTCTTPKALTLQLHLNRNGEENAIRTLQRLEISTSKKVGKLLTNVNHDNDTKKNKYEKGEGRRHNKNNNNKKKKQKMMTKKKPHNQDHQDLPFIYSQPNSNNDHNNNHDNDNASDVIPKRKKIDIHDLTTIELIRQLSLSDYQNENYLYGISIPSISTLLSNKTNITKNEEKEEGTTSFISNPPTILSIQTPFENFSQNIYVGVPITIQTKLLHSTHVIISWFANDELIQYNSLFYVPSIDDIGKIISVHLKPMNRNRTNSTTSASSSSFIGPSFSSSSPTSSFIESSIGEETYQFQKKVEPLPYMPIVSPLRDDFINIRRRSCQGGRNNSELQQQQQDFSASDDDMLRVVTYNILADLYVSRDVDGDNNETTKSTTTQFPHVPNFDHLSKIRRIPMIVAELLSYNADIICLQEVDGGLIYTSFIEPVMNAMGYDGYYSNKASCQREGCALFWSRKVFDVEKRDIDLEAFSIRDLFDITTKEKEEKDCSSDGNDENDNLSRRENICRWDSMDGINKLLREHYELRKVTMEKIGQVVQIATLRLKNSSNIGDESSSCEKSSITKPSHCVVANTHLFYHPLADHIRAIQVYAVCKKVDEIRRRKLSSSSSQSPPPSPFLLCGDLNSDPLSGAAQLLFTRIIRPEHHDCWKNLYNYKWDCCQNDFMVEHGYIGNEVGVTELKCEEEVYDDVQEEEKDGATGLPLPPTISLPPTFPNLVSGCSEMPKFTNYAVDFVDTLDYIIASETSELEPFGFGQKRSAPMPVAEDVTKYVAMPNEVMPSDHVSVVCDLEWKYQKPFNEIERKES